MANARTIAVINDGSTPLPSFKFPGMPVGFIVCDSTGQNWQLTASTATVDHTAVEKVAGNPQLRWLAYTGGGSAGLTDGVTLQGDGSSGNKYAIKAAQTDGVYIQGAGTVASPINSPKLQNGLNAKRGVDILDADATINPGTDKCSEYRLLGPLTANRILTIASGGTPLTTQTVNVVSFDTSAFTLVVKNGAGSTVFTFGANPGAGVIRWTQLYFNGTNFVQNVAGYAQST